MAATAILALIGFAARPRDPAPPTRSELPSPTRPLFKPEPDSLLRNPTLKLSADQRKAISSIETGWRKERAKLLKAMGAYAPKRGRVDQIASNLADYSDLSRAYDAARNAAWTAALKPLTESQRREVAR